MIWVGVDLRPGQGLFIASPHRLSLAAADVTRAAIAAAGPSASPMTFAGAGKRLQVHRCIAGTVHPA